ncbi:hypothetical protein GCM10022419_131060 [Nonomuraea rosea]|uniref:Core-binding (CB) domain-containing protein n=1 Tax=Nonomuraea rosea TaxID=638574 RepID=A0ABP7A1N7_9ACTN
MNDSTNLNLAGAITALAAEKRAVGYAYDATERVLARFEAFCRVELPGLGTVTRASAEAWIASARRRGVRSATLQGLAAPVRELARWLGRRGTKAYVLPAGVRPRPVRYVPHIYTDRELAALLARRTAAATVPRPRSGTWSCRCCSGRSAPAACALPKPGCCAPPTSTPVPGSCRSPTPKGGKDRQVPVCGSLRERMAGYRAQVAGQPGWDWFFSGGTAGR